MVDNKITKFFDKGDIKIVYVGGSITEGAGASDKSRRWTTQITAYLNSLPLGNTRFFEINEGIGGTESTYGMMRVERDVCAHKPEIVFIDFSQNDKCISEELSAVMYEGIIRRLMKLDNVPYVICIGVTDNRNESNRSDIHKKLAAHYGLCYIDVRDGMDQIMGKADLVLNTARNALFRPDNTHPVEKGYDFYTEYIKSFLNDNAFAKPCGEPMRDDFCDFSGTFINAREFDKTGDWSEYGEGDWNEKNLGRGGSGLISSDRNASLSIKFRGKAFMLCYRLGRTFGKMSVTFDGKEEILDLYYETDNQPVTGISNFALEDIEHTLVIRPLGEKNEESTSCDIKIDFVIVPNIK